MKSNMIIKIGILTISTSCSRNEKVDISGEKLYNLIEIGKIIPNGKVIKRGICPDDLEQIQIKLLTWTNDRLDLILTTGGTGLSPTDVTPEATKGVIDKEITGMMLGMLAKSLSKTPFAMLSRAICGVKKQTLIINLPGSVKGSNECLEALVQVIPHAIEIITDRKLLIEESHHKIQNPKKQSKVKLNFVALRNRTSIYEITPVEKALKLIEDVVEVQHKIGIQLDKALNYVIYDDIFSKEPIPPYRASIKDGYAVRSNDFCGEFEVVDSLIAGETPINVLNRKECVRVNTGSAVPDEADAVVQVEDTELIKASEDNRAELVINIKIHPKKNQEIREIGSDIPQGLLVIKKRTRLTESEIGILATIGESVVNVYQKPVIGIMSTGNELEDYSVKEISKYHIRDSNRIMLQQFFKKIGYETVDCGISIDDPDTMLNNLEMSFKKCDILVTTGSVSMGDHDCLKNVLIEDLNAKIHFGRVLMKPGKPATFATCIFDGKLKYVFALPGNPVSALVTSQIFVVHALNCMQDDKTDKRLIRIKTGENFKLDPQRPEYHRAKIRWDPTTGEAKAFSTNMNQASSCLLSMNSADCLLILPKKGELDEIQANDIVDALLIN